MGRHRYSKLRNCGVKLLHLKKQKYYESLDVNKITDNKNFWKTINSLFSNKTNSTNAKITPLGNKDILGEESKVTYNEVFSYIEKEVQIETMIIYFFDILEAIKKYKNHPSILRIISANFRSVTTVMFFSYMSA